MGSIHHHRLNLQSQYGYTPLPSERSIRLVQILQETSSGIPQCNLTTTSLDNGLPFVALSYTWGSPSDQTGKGNLCVDRSCRILCNGHVLAVTQNLHDFLKRATPSKSTTWIHPKQYIWIDAICIDQNSLHERSAQVMLMAEIYRAARTVAVWLGEQDYETYRAVELLERISAAPSDDLNDLKRLQIDDSKMLKVLGKHGGSTVHWQALKRMFSRSWFSRIWIIQEITFAENIMVLCGGFSLLWEDCMKGCNFLDYSVVNDLQISKIPYAGPNAEILASFQELRSVNFLDVLIMSRSFEASDPRDKIYAILGLSNLGPNLLPAQEVIHVDYELAPAEVFLEATRALMTNSKDLNFLAEVEDPLLRRIADLPTWVPDFSSTYRPSIYQQSLTFRAAGNLKRSVTSFSDQRLLGTVAYGLGEVVYEGYLGAGEPFIEYFPRMMTPLFELPPKYVTGEDRAEALWRTMIQNGMDWISPAAADTAQEFRNWILSSIVQATTQGDKSTSTQDGIDRIMTYLENYSKIDSTGILPSPQDVQVATKNHSNNFDSHLLDQTRSVSKYGHELTFYQHTRVFRTKNGLLGLGQPSLRTGNSLWIIPGVSVPMVLKPTALEDHFTVLGPAYVHGIMNGEALNRDQLECRSIILE